MKIDKLLKKKSLSRIVCPICSSKDLKRFSFSSERYENKLTFVVFTFLCINDHMWNLKEFIKSGSEYGN